VNRQTTALFQRRVLHIALVLHDDGPLEADTRALHSLRPPLDSSARVFVYWFDAKSTPATKAAQWASPRRRSAYGKTESPAVGDGRARVWVPQLDCGAEVRVCSPDHFESLRLHFTDMIARCRWALDNPHLSLHIPSESRISVATQRKKNGHPRRPGRSMSSIISNLHLLLRVPSFGRWPLRLHFLAPDVHKAWEKWCATTVEPMRSDLPVLTDFRGQEAVSAAKKETADARKGKKSATVVEKSPVKAGARSSITISDSEEQDSETEEAEEITGKLKYGVHALPATYDHLRAYIAKGDDVFRFEREGSCVVCREKLESGRGLHALCSNDGCEGVGHLSCWSDHLLADERRNRAADARADEEPILPVQGVCPKCHGPVQWSEMMTELTLRVRGPEEVQRLLRKKPRATAAT
jgi:structure-specific endonuclease subunit SLX1